METGKDKNREGEGACSTQTQSSSYEVFPDGDCRALPPGQRALCGLALSDDTGYTPKRPAFVTLAAAWATG